MTTCTACPMTCMRHEIQQCAGKARKTLAKAWAQAHADGGVGSTVVISMAAGLLLLATVSSAVSVAAPLMQYLPSILASVI